MIKLKKNRFQIIFLIIFTFTLIIQSFIPSTTKNEISSTKNLSKSPLGISAHDTLTGIGYGLNYTEYANRTDSFSHTLNYNTLTYGTGSSSPVLATNWEGWKMNVQVFDLTLNRTYINNYNFENGETSWTEVEVDTNYDNIQTSGAGDDIYVETGGGPSGGADDCAHVQQLGVYTTSYRFDALDRAAFSQQINIQGGSVIWAGIDFDYRGDCAWASSLFHAYIRIGGSEVWQMGYGPLQNPGTWQHQPLMSLDTTPFASTVTIEIGLESDASVGYSTQPQPIFRFDNFRLYIITPILPSLVSLQMNSLPVSDNGLGNGLVTQIPGTRWLSSPLATFSWGPIPSLTTPDLPASIDFNCRTNLLALKEENFLSKLAPGSYGTEYTTTDGLNTTWSMYSLIATPDGYGNHYYNFSIPLDWGLTGLYEPQNPTVNIFSQVIGGRIGDGYVQINLTDITNSPAGYWRLTAESPNYLTEVTSTDLGTPQTDFRIGDTLRVRSTITNAPSGFANLSIYNPSGTIWNSEVLQPASNQFFFSDINLVGASTPAGEYETVVWWNNRSALGSFDANEAGLKRTIFTVTHGTGLESYDIATIQTNTFTDVLYGETFVLKAKYTDTDNGLGIDGANVQIEWIDGLNHTMTGLGGGFYQIDSLNTSQIQGVYTLDLYADKNYFDIATKQISVELAHHTSLTPNTTSLTVDWGEIVAIRTFYNDTDINSGIIGASVFVSNGWQIGSWFNISAGSGYYDLTFDTTWTEPDTTYDVDIIADRTNYQSKSRQISIFVKARSSELSNIPPPAVPIQDSINITLSFLDGVNGNGITNTTNQLTFTINSTLNGFHTIYEIGSGIYYLEINTSAPIFAQPGIYRINLDAFWVDSPYYANQSLSIKLTVRQIITSLTYDPTGDIPYGNNVNLTVHYTVADTDSKYNGIGINGAQINITTLGYTYNINYTVTPHPTIAGDYIITIYNNTLNTFTTYSLNIQASGLMDYAPNSKSLGIRIRRLYSSLIITPVGNVPYGNNVNVSLSITYSDPTSQWYNGLPITGLTNVDFLITGGHLFNLYEVGNGNYIFEILNGTVSSLGSYNDYITLLQGGIYLSDVRSVSWTIRKLISTVIVDPILDFPYGNDLSVTIHVSYDDSVSQWYNGKGITGLVKDNFTLTGGHSFDISEIGNGDYTLIIYNGTILTIQSYLATLSLNAGPIFLGDSSSVSFTVRNLFTELVANLVPAQPIGEDVVITAFYRVKDSVSLYYNGIGIGGALINITSGSYNYGTDYVINEISNGEYQITIFSSTLTGIQSYTVNLKASGVTNYTNATTSSSFDVRAIATSFTYVSPSPAAWGFNVTLELSYSVEDTLSSQNGNPLSGAALITVNESNPTFSGDWSDLGNGLYSIELDTSGFSMGTYWANISIYMNNYVNRSVLVKFIIRAHFTQVTYDIPDPTPWGKNSTLTVYFEDIDLGFARIPSVLDIKVNETQGFIYNWVDNGDSFAIEIDTRDPTTWSVGTHKVQIKIYQNAYQNSSTFISLRIKTRDTDLIYQTPDITPFQQDAIVKFQYRDLVNSTLPVGINNNTNPQIPGLQNSAGNVSISVVILDSSLIPVAATFQIFTMEFVAGYGNGWYNITIDTNSLGLTGLYYVDINVKWLKLSYYNNQSIRIGFNVRNITALLEYQPPGSTPYAEGGYVSIWLKYSDLDNSIPIDGATVSIYYIEDPSNLQLTPFTKILGNYTVEGNGVGDNDRGSGWYLTKIFMGSDKLDAFGSYDFSIRFNKTNYDTRSIANITFAIRRGYTQFTSPYAPQSFVINGLVNISLNYIDSESGLGIVNTTSGDQVLLNATWPYNATIHPDVVALFGWSNALNRWIPSGDIANYPMGDDGRYQILFNFTKIPIGNHTMVMLNISAGRNVQSQILNITFIIEPQTSVIGVTFPQPVVWGVNSVFNVTYQQIDGTGIPGTVLNLWDLDRGLYWNSAYWNYNMVNAGTGLYQVTVNTTLYSPPNTGFFRIRVEASGGAYTPRSLNVFLNVRPIDSQVILTPPASKGWNTLANITILYYDTYNSVPINDTDLSDGVGVLINITNIPQTYWKLYNGLSNGYYIIEINTSYWLTLNEIGHPVIIDISWNGPPYYKNWTSLSVGVPVRSRNTDLSYTPPLQIPYGENSSIIFTWNDIEIMGGVGIENLSGNVQFELRDWVNQVWNSSGFAWISELGNGDYQVLINTSNLPTIGSYTFTAYFNWPGKPFYSNRSVTFNINIRQINTLLIYGIPAAVPWGNPLQFDVQFEVSDSSSSLDGNYLSGAILNITSLSNSGGPLSPISYGNNYSVIENGLGSYTIIIFNNTLNIDTYSLSIRASRYNTELIYKNASASLTFSVRRLITTLTFTSPLPVPWGNDIDVIFDFKVSDSASLYWNGISLDVNSWILNNGSLWTEGIEYSVSGSAGDYIITISHANVYGSNIGTFQFDATVVSTTNYLRNASSNNVPFTIRALTTSISYIPATPVPFGNNVSIQLYYNVSDPESTLYNGLGLDVPSWVLANTNGTWNSGTDYIISGNAGVFTLTILNNVYSSIGTNTFNILANMADARYASAQFNNIPFTIRALITSISYIPATPAPFGNNITIQVFYNVSDPASLLYSGLGLDVNTWSLSNSSGPWTSGLEYQATGSNGVFTITILNNVYSSLGTFSLNIQASSSNPHFASATFNNIPFTIRALTTILTYIPSTPIPFGNNISIRVFYNVSDPTSILYNGLGLDTSSFILSNISGSWTSGIEYLVTGNNGIYDFIILSNVYNNVGSRSFSVQANPASNIFSSSIINNIIFIIRPLTTTISIIPVSPVPFGNNVTGLQVFFNVSDLESSYNGLGLDTTFSLSNGSGSWTEGMEYLVSGSGGAYTFTILSQTYSNIGSYSFNILAMPTSSLFSSALFNNVPFTIRRLTTALSYFPSLSTPFGNDVSVQIFMNVSDPSSVLYDGLGITVSTWTLSNISGSWTLGTEYNIIGSAGAYLFTIFSDVYSTTGSYSFRVIADPGNSIFASATINNVPFIIRSLITAVTYNPPITQPFGNNVTMEVFFNISDADSIFDGMGLDVSWILSNSSGLWSSGVEYTISGSAGVYTLLIMNSIYNTPGNYKFNILGAPANQIYSNASFIGISFTIRSLITTITTLPTVTQPWGNPIYVTVFYNVTDPASTLYNSLGLDVSSWVLSNGTNTWTSGIEYSISGGNGAFLLTIDNDTVTTQVGSYTFNIAANPSDNLYQSASFSGIPFTIRPLTTRLTYTPVPNIPWGNNVTISFLYNVSDSASLFYNNRGITSATLTVIRPSGWTLWTDYTSSGNKGAYLLDISNETTNIVQNYDIDVQASAISSIYEPATIYGLPFTIRQLLAVLTYDPVTPVPYGNPVNISVHYLVSDPESDWYNRQPILADNFNITNPGVWNQSLNWTWTGANGDYIITILNNTATTVGSYTIDLVGIPLFNVFSQAVFYNIPFIVRPLTTRLTYIPVPNTPYGNNVSIIFMYNISDAESLWHHNQPIPWANLAITSPAGWISGLNYSSVGNSGIYTIEISNETINLVKNYIINVLATPNTSIYETASVLGLPFTIRRLATVLTYQPITPIPWGNNVSISVQYRVSDPESDWYHGLGIPLNDFNITDPMTWNQSQGDWTWSGSNGNYVITIINNTVNIIGSYTMDLIAIPISAVYSQANLFNIPFTIRPLATVITYNPITPVPYGNNVNISVYYRVSDPESVLYNGQGIPVINFNITNSGWIQNINWTWSGVIDNWIITIFNNTANTIGSYTIDLVSIPVSNVYSQATFENIPFSIRTLNTFLTYPTPAKNSWGNNASIDLQWQVIDSASQYHNGELIEGGRLIVTNPSNWSYWIDYISEDQTSGAYTLNINKDTINEIKTYIINIKAFHLNVNYYGNTTYIGLPFSILQVVTSHTTIINSTYYLDGIGGWPWGDQVNVTIMFDDTDHGTLVPNSNISIHGDTGSPYEAGNLTINGIKSTVGGSATGIFVILINGSVAENAVGYNFYINLFHYTGNYLNHSYIFTISFRKSVSQIILRAPSVFIPWGDNLSIIFTYNNSEAVGFPGIPNANVNVTVDDPTANGYFSFYENSSWGPGAWIITMNTTWADVSWNTQDEITFTITAVAPQTIIAITFHTVFITPLDSDLKAITWDNAIFLEQANSFNITVELRDRSHFNTTEGDFNPIVNNSYWTPTGSMGQYDNIRFIITTREGQFTNYTWYWGDISVSVLDLGVFKLTFYFNQTPTYPQIQELLDYLVMVEVIGDRLDSSQTQVTIDLKLQTHKTAMTFNWTYANTIITPSFNLAPFPENDFSNGSVFIYGDIINIYLYWWDLDSGALNPGISSALVSVNWTSALYYRVFNMYELFSHNESYRGMFWVQINTRVISGQPIVGNYVLNISATLETYQRIYLITHGFVSFTIDPVPVNLTLQQPILSIPYQDNAEIKIRVTNIHENNSGIFLSSAEIDIINIAGVMGGSKWLVGTNPLAGEYSLFFYTTTFTLGFYNATVRINKLNHELITQNFTFEIREIATRISLQTTQNITLKYRYEDTIRFLFIDNETYPYHIPIGDIPASPVDPNLDFNITNWYGINGIATTLTDEVAQGVYKIKINASIDVGYYIVSIYIKLPNYQIATYQLSINITKANSEIILINPSVDSFEIWKLGSREIEVLFQNEFGEPLNGTLTYTIKTPEGVFVTSGTLQPTSNGHFVAKIDTSGLQMQGTYKIYINGTPTSNNYNDDSITLTAFIKPIWEHPFFIILMIGVAVVAGAYGYRKIRWFLLPREVKAIELAKKDIKKGKIIDLPYRDIKDRESMFRMLFADPWNALGIKPPKLVLPEVVLFATELSAILRTRVTSPEAESMINTLKTMSVEDAERYLGEQKVPPEATRRLLTIAGLIEKERLEVLSFAQLLGDIKDMEISYSQAEEIMNLLLTLSPSDADSYLEAMVIPVDERQRLLDMVGVKPFVAPKKLKPVKEEKKKKEKEKAVEEQMSVAEIKAELDKIPGLSDLEKESLIKDMEKLSLKEQKEILKNLKG